jgi:hypothetical protein
VAFSIQQENLLLFLLLLISDSIYSLPFSLLKKLRDIFDEEAFGGEVKGVLVGGVLNVLVLLVVVVAGVVVQRKGLVGRILTEGASILLKLSYEKL